MLHWAERHVPEALLIPAGVGALSVTVLSDIDETVPWGHELGIGVSQLAFAYVGAYIFNWLIVERPRGSALRGYYKAAWSGLMQVARDFQFLIGGLQPEARWGENLIGTASLEDIQFMTASFNWRKIPRGGLKISDRQEAYDSLAPILDNLDPPVSVAIAALSAAKFTAR